MKLGISTDRLVVGDGRDEIVLFLKLCVQERGAV